MSIGFLYIDDDPSSREVMSILLCNVMGYTDVTILEDSTNFLERLGSMPKIPDIILLDIQMRPSDGFAILKMIRERQEYKSARVIALTASVTVTDVERLRSAGFNGLIGKPIKQKIFPELLKRITQGIEVWSIP